MNNKYYDFTPESTNKYSDFVPENSSSFTDKLLNMAVSVASLPYTIVGTLYGAGKELVNSPSQSMTDAYQALRSLGQNQILPTAGTLLHAGTMGILPNPFDATQQSSVGLLSPNYNLPTFTPDNPSSPVGEVTKTLATAFPIFKTAEATEAAVKALSDLLPNFMGKNLLSKGAQLGAAGVTTAPIAGVDPTQGALTNLALGGIGSGISNLQSKTPSLADMVHGMGDNGALTADEFSKILSKIPTDLKVPLGNLANSAPLQLAEGGLSGIPFSGVNTPYINLNERLRENLSSLTEDAPQNVADPNREAYNAKKEAYQESVENTGNQYEKLANIADKYMSSAPSSKNSSILDNSGNPISTNTPSVNPQYAFNRTAFDDAINEQINRIKPLMVNPEAEKYYAPTLNQLMNFKDNTPIPDFKTAVNTDKFINQLSREMPMNAIPVDRAALSNLSAGLKQSINDSTQGLPDEVGNALTNAKQARIYQASFEKLPGSKQNTPFYNIYLSPQGENTGNFINSYVKPSTGMKDNSSLLNSLISKVPDDTRQMIADYYLTSGGNNDTLQGKIKNLSSLNTPQRNIFFGDKAPTAEQTNALAQLYPRGKSPGFSYPTGLTGGKSTIAASGFGLGLLHPALIPLIGALPFVGRGLTSALSSDWLKESYLKSLSGQRSSMSPDLMNNLRFMGLPAAYTDQNSGANK